MDLSQKNLGIGWVWRGFVGFVVPKTIGICDGFGDLM